MRTRTAALATLLLAMTACADTAAPPTASTNPEDLALVQGVAPEVGALGSYLAPALGQVRTRDGDLAAAAQRGELRRLHEQLQLHREAGDSTAAAELRLRLRLAAAHAIRAGLGDAPLEELLADNDRAMTQLRVRVRERTRLHQDTASDQQRLGNMQQLQEQARIALHEGRHEEALELAARVREQWRAWSGAN